MKRERQRNLAVVALVLDLGVEMAEQAYPAFIAEPYPSPGTSFFAGLTNACQREPSSRLISVASILGSVSRPMRRPLSWADITLVSLTTN